jgi:hypothetical protein
LLLAAIQQQRGAGMTNQQLEQFQLQQLQQRADPKALVVQQQSQQLQQQLAQQLQGGAQSLHQIPWDVSGAGDGIVAASAAGALVQATASQAISGQAGSGAKPFTFSLAPEGLPAGYPGPAKTRLASDVPSGSDTLAKKGCKEEGDDGKGKKGDSERDFNKKKRKVGKEEESSTMLTKGSKGEAPKKDREGKRKKRDDGDDRRKESKKRKSGSGALLDQLCQAATAMDSQNGQEETTSADSPPDEATVRNKSPLKEEVDAVAGVKSGSERREAQTGSSPDPPESVVGKVSEGAGEEEGGGKKPLSAILSDAAARDARRREESGDTDAGGGNSYAQRSATRVEVIDDVP